MTADFKEKERKYCYEADFGAESSTGRVREKRPRVGLFKLALSIDTIERATLSSQGEVGVVSGRNTLLGKKSRRWKPAHLQSFHYKKTIRTFLSKNNEGSTSLRQGCRVWGADISRVRTTWFATFLLQCGKGKVLHPKHARGKQEREEKPLPIRLRYYLLGSSQTLGNWPDHPKRIESFRNISKWECHG